MINLLDREITEKKHDDKLYGLSSEEAMSNLQKYGENKLLSDKKAKPLKIFLCQFKDVMVIILLISCVISVILGEITDALTITVIVMLNAILGFIQEYKTEKTLLALKNMTSPNAKVYRDGHLTTVNSAEIVPDDIIHVEAGDKIPADAVILNSHDLYTDESILTGESAAVAKSVKNINNAKSEIGRTDEIFGGTTVTKGSADARVLATGQNAEIGKISSMLKNIDESPTPLQIKLAELGKTVAVICIIVCFVVAGAGMLRGENVFDMLMTGITIAIAAIPEGLPATVTIALALAVNRMLKRNALVHKLHSVETLGSTSVICTDKTGTITENKMTVTKIYSHDKFFNVTGTGERTEGKILDSENKIANISDNLINAMILCENADIYPDVKNQNWITSGDSTEISLMIAAAKTGADINKIKTENKRKNEIPFESETRFMSVTCGNTVYSKGAADTIIKKCKYTENDDNYILLTKEKKNEILKKCDDMSSEGLRVLAFSYSDIAGDDIFLGLCGISDMPRPEAKKAVSMCHNAHIKVIMITGDHKNTAAAVAKKAGILKANNTVMTGEEMNKLTDDELSDKIGKVTVFARATPADKLRIVRILKNKGEIVTMTGDGVNDAPAVKEADIGVAMGITGTDVTREAADMVLLDDNFATLASAVKEGRGIYDNIRKFVRYLLSCNIGEVLTMFLGIVMGMPMILLPAQILLVNLVTDGLPAIALGVEPPEKDCMNRSPRKKNESFFSDGLITKIVFRGILIGICTLGSFSVIYSMTKSTDYARTSALLTLVMSQLFHVFECKSEKKNIFTVPYFNNPKLLGAVMISALICFAAIYFPALSVIFETVPLNKTQVIISLSFAVFAPILNTFTSLFK